MPFSSALAIINVIQGAGLLIYPLAACSLAMVFIICERAYALRRNAVMPDDLVDAIVRNRPYSGGKHSTLARILAFSEEHRHEPDAVRAFARLEINGLERGVPYLDIIYAVAPLIGLTGTVTGLLKVFATVSPESGLPDPVGFTQGVALALSATVLGLCIAIPALVGGGYLQRKVENYAVQVDSLLERINSRRALSGSAPGEQDPAAARPSSWVS